MNWTRCGLSHIAIGWIVWLGIGVPLAGAAPPAGATPDATQPVPMIHVTDLFRPHNDPDDHWDLASVYALAWQNKVDLRAIFIDYPLPAQHNDPDVLAVAQLNYLTGKAVPVVVGTPRWIEPADASKPENVAALRGVRAMLRLLRTAPRPVVISILGSSRDVAIAGRLEPELFARKCAAIYLNAGTGQRQQQKVAQFEWNVRLDRQAYAAIFQLPCPVYWMPCFETLDRTRKRHDSYGTYYRFHQGAVLPHLSRGLQNYFAYMFLHGNDATQRNRSAALRPNWLQYLLAPPDRALQTRICAMDRNMWCTGGFLHAIGKTVTCDGEIVPLDGCRNPVFTFDSIQVQCSAAGTTSWQSGTSSPPRFIFHVRDTARYDNAMTMALKQLLMSLPKER